MNQCTNSPLRKGWICRRYYRNNQQHAKMQLSVSENGLIKWSVSCKYSEDLIHKKLRRSLVNGERDNAESP